MYGQESQGCCGAVADVNEEKESQITLLEAQQAGRHPIALPSGPSNEKLAGLPARLVDPTAITNLPSNLINRGSSSTMQRYGVATQIH